MIRSTSDSEVLIENRRPLLIASALVFPTAFVGTLMIMDYPGPPGPFGLVEFFGWWAICVAVTKLSAELFALFSRRRHRFLALLGGIALPAILAVLLYLDVRPATPTAVKQMVEYSLQAVGAVVLAALVLFAIRVGLTSRQYRMR
jgi:hypothetical protein